MEGKEMKKTLYKSRKDRFLFGVCGGLAEYFEVDPITNVNLIKYVRCFPCALYRRCFGQNHC